jgi:hypothetical protein
MKVNLLAAGVLASLSMSGCVTYGQTGVLFTPVGVAGIHSFAPTNKSPDDMGEARKTAERVARAAQ